MMKFKYIYLLVALLLFNCERDKAIYDGEPLANFAVESSNYLVTESNDSFSLEVWLTASAPQDVSITINVDAAKSVAVEGTDFNISQKTITIPAGNLFGAFSIEGDFDAASPDGKSVNLFITSSDVDLAGFRTSYDLTLFKFCPSDLAGNYVYTDGNVASAVITETGLGTYRLSRDNAFTTEYWIDFSDVCGVLTITGSQIQNNFGLATSGSGVVDEATGTLVFVFNVAGNLSNRTMTLRRQ